MSDVAIFPLDLPHTVSLPCCGAGTALRALLRLTGLRRRRYPFLS